MSCSWNWFVSAFMKKTMFMWPLGNSIVVVPTLTGVVPEDEEPALEADLFAAAEPVPEELLEDDPHAVAKAATPTIAAASANRLPIVRFTASCFRSSPFVGCLSTDEFVIANVGSSIRTA
jgi:hypothetical protein